MKILKENMEELLLKVSYSRKSEYEDKELNDFFNYWLVFEEKEDDILRLKNESIDSILYTKYYWCTKYKKRYEELYGYDAGIDPIISKENLIWAPNAVEGQHTIEVLEQIVKKLREIDS